EAPSSSPPERAFLRGPPSAAATSGRALSRAGGAGAPEPRGADRRGVAWPAAAGGASQRRGGAEERREEDEEEGGGGQRRATRAAARCPNRGPRATAQPGRGAPTRGSLRPHLARRALQTSPPPAGSTRARPQAPPAPSRGSPPSSNVVLPAPMARIWKAMPMWETAYASRHHRAQPSAERAPEQELPEAHGGGARRPDARAGARRPGVRQ
ncbi:unnamed protein product, partial [Prorocentrum cordatum]